MLQTTLKRAIHCTGIGLHSGNQITLTLRPATEDTGILFHVATPSGIKTITPSPKAVQATSLATTLGTHGASLSTIEHLMAALRGLGVDNVHVDVSGKEIPIMDGSAAYFVDKILETGLLIQKKARKVLRFKAPLTVSNGNKWIQVEPSNSFQVDYTIDFPHPLVGIQRKSITVTPQTFEQVARARTFCFLKDVEAMQAHGLALGGSLDNAIVLGPDNVLNPEGLRSPDEFVKHKILDFIGDMAVLPLPLQGKFTIHCSGHGLNNEFLCTAAENAPLYLEEISLGQDIKEPRFLSPRQKSARLATAVA